MSSTPGIEIRLAGPDDAAAIASLLADAFAEYRPLYTLAGYAATAVTSESVISRIQEGPVWVAFGAEQMLGTVSIIPKGESLYVRGMAVAPNARGRQIGAMLLKQVETFAVSQGVLLLSLSTTPFLHRAIRLYEKSGFRRTKDGATDLFGTPLFTMEKGLD